MIKSYSIRNIKIDPGLVLAPMSGVTTCSFRRLIKRLNPGAVGLVISEFVSVEGMTRQTRRTLEMMRYQEEERPFAIQIFGYDIARMSDAARIVQDAGVDIVDINCGCPAPKVVRKGGGCELMRQPDHLAQIFRAVRKAISIPLTMKMRSGWDENSKNFREIAHIAESEGIEAITIHGRTRAQLYRGEADWSVVEEIANTLKIPVCGSGDVVDRASAEQRQRSNIAGLFIGRAAIYNPYVFSEILDGKSRNLRSNPELQLKILSDYIELLREEFLDHHCTGKVKQLASQMCRGGEWRKPLLLANTLQQQIEVLKSAGHGTAQTEAPMLAGPAIM